MLRAGDEAVKKVDAAPAWRGLYSSTTPGNPGSVRTACSGRGRGKAGTTAALCRARERHRPEQTLLTLPSPS